MDKRRIETLLFLFSAASLLFGCQSINSTKLPSDSLRETASTNIDDFSLNDRALNEGVDEEYRIIVAGYICGSDKSNASHQWPCRLI